MHVKWPKDQRQSATEAGRALFSVAIDGNKADGKTGRYESYGPADVKLARIAFFFSLKLTHKFIGQKKPVTKHQVIDLLDVIADFELNGPDLDRLIPKPRSGQKKSATRSRLSQKKSRKKTSK